MSDDSRAAVPRPTDLSLRRTKKTSPNEPLPSIGMSAFFQLPRRKASRRVCEPTANASTTTRRLRREPHASEKDERRAPQRCVCKRVGRWDTESSRTS